MAEKPICLPLSRARSLAQISRTRARVRGTQTEIREALGARGQLIAPRSFAHSLFHRDIYPTHILPLLLPLRNSPTREFRAKQHTAILGAIISAVGRIEGAVEGLTALPEFSLFRLGALVHPRARAPSDSTRRDGKALCSGGSCTARHALLPCRR